MNLAIIAITDGGAALARRLAAIDPEVEVWLPERLRSDDGCRYFEGPAAKFLAELFGRVDGLVCIMATGIVVRAIAPQLRGKAVDPAVVVMDEAGRYAVSLISGHLGGANALARELAELTGGEAVITTATDVNGLLAWDEAARRADLVPEPLEHIRRLNTLLLRGEPVALVDRRGRIAPWFRGTPGVESAANFAEALARPGGKVFVTHRLIPHPERYPDLLLLRPRDLVVGIGCNRGTSADEIEAAVRQELERAFLAFSSIAALATIEDKADEAGLCAFAGRHGFPLDYHPAAALNSVPVPSPPSPHARAAVGANGVCEPAAILSSGGGSLLVSKKKVGNVTVAVAEKP